MNIDALVAEIGSTTTVVNAFDNLDSNPRFLGSGFSPTTVLEGDVTIGLQKAIDDLKQKIGVSELIAKETFASSSAAGGLKMSVHGLVYDMTVKAAKEAALGAGANIKMVTSGLLDEYQLKEILEMPLNIIMISGGVDYGERITAIENAKKIAAMRRNIPVIYAGNIQNQTVIQSIFKQYGQLDYLYLSKNVYPKIDVLEVEDTRKLIQDAFEKHIIHAPGMEKVKEIINESIIPTPGAVLEAAILLESEIGDLVTIDIGGATTDVHSVTKGKEEIEKILISPEPFAKRTVEGDLGVYINKDNIIDIIGIDRLKQQLKLSDSAWVAMMDHYQAIPNIDQIPLTERLAQEAMIQALGRHCGKLVNMYTASGKTTYAEGKDLSNVKYLIATGGALTRLPNKESIIRNALAEKNKLLLLPPASTTILVDNDYIMASLGVLSKKHPNAALQLLKQSLGIR
ncbi:MAG: glutamate mutase L [Bacilli bacterium]|nr:glutamate mutase L [Bacilli bacterium]MBN2877728.1 glutamate mutase L [Bacilli bacterium]